MIIETTRSIYGHAVITAAMFGQQWVPEPNSTLNEKLSIASGEVLTQDDRHKLNFYVIGNKAARFISSADGIPEPSHYIPDPGSASLFGLIPFVLREIDNDLTAVERENYCLRRIEQIGDRQYFAYYGRRFNPSSVEVKMQKRERLNDDSDEVTTNPFIPTNENLNPQPVQIYRDDDNNRVIKTDRNALAVSAVLTINFTARDAAEFMEVVRIKYNNERASLISEIGMCFGVDRAVDGPSVGNQTVRYRETIATQLVNQIPCLYHIAALNDGFQFTSDIGIKEPLFEVVPIE